MSWYYDWLNSKTVDDLLRGETYPIVEIMNGEDKMKNESLVKIAEIIFEEFDINVNQLLEFAKWKLEQGKQEVIKKYGSNTKTDENKYLKNQVAVLHSTLFRIMATRKPNREYSDGVNEIYDWTRAALDEYSTNEFNRRCELEGE